MRIAGQHEQCPATDILRMPLQVVPLAGKQLSTTTSVPHPMQEDVSQRGVPVVEIIDWMCEGLELD